MSKQNTISSTLTGWNYADVTRVWQNIHKWRIPDSLNFHRQFEASVHPLCFTARWIVTRTMGSVWLSTPGGSGIMDGRGRKPSADGRTEENRWSCHPPFEFEVDPSFLPRLSPSAPLRLRVISCVFAAPLQRPCFDKTEVGWCNGGWRNILWIALAYVHQSHQRSKIIASMWDNLCSATYAIAFFHRHN